MKASKEHLAQFVALNNDPQRDTDYTAWKARWVAFREDIEAMWGEDYWDYLSTEYDMGYCQQEDAIQG